MKTRKVGVEIVQNHENTRTYPSSLTLWAMKNPPNCRYELSYLTKWHIVSAERTDDIAGLAGKGLAAVARET